MTIPPKYYGSPYKLDHGTDFRVGYIRNSYLNVLVILHNRVIISIWSVN